jgi:hypothetical protein
MRIIEAFKQFFDDNGDPLAGGKLEFFETGSTSTHKATYSDAAETVPNTNPVVLDAEGRAGDIFGTGSYRVVSYEVTGAGDVQIEVFDPVGGTFGIGAFDDWDSEKIYDISNLVTGSDGQYYRSLIAANVDYDPTTSPPPTPPKWEQIFIEAATKFRSLAVADLADPSTPSVLTAAETTNTVISNYKATGADHVFTMPAAHINGNVMFMVGDEFQVDIEPVSGDNFYLNGAAMAADEHIVNSSDTIGRYIVGFCANINGTLKWMFESKYYEWQEATP